MRNDTNFVINNFKKILKEKYSQLNLKIIVFDKNIIENLIL